MFVEGEECLATSQRPELWAPPEAAGERHPEYPVPRASLSAAGFECSLRHLLSGALPEPKIAQSMPRAPLWLPPPFTPASRKDPSSPELGEAGRPRPCPREGRRLHTALCSKSSGCSLSCTCYVSGQGSLLAVYIFSLKPHKSTTVEVLLSSSFTLFSLKVETKLLVCLKMSGQAVCLPGRHQMKMTGAKKGLLESSQPASQPLTTYLI